MQRLVSAVIAQSKSLDIICRPWALGPDPSKEQHLPSWIPKLSAAPFELVRGRYERVEADPLVGLPGQKKTYKASGSSTPIPPFKEKVSSSFFVHGFILDKIEVRGETALGGNIPAGWFAIIPWNHEEDPIPDKLWKTLIVNVGLDGPG
jgi:hypothetical protein